MFGYFRRKLEKFQANKRAVYDDQYYKEEYLRHLNAPYGFIVKPYQKYLAFCIAKLTKLKKGDKILEIGCGIGVLTGEFKKLGYDVIGLETNGPAIKNSVCKENCKAVKDISKLDYADNFFDLVISKETLEHIFEQDIDNCIKEWDRVCKGVQVHIIAVKERGITATKNPAHVNVNIEDWWINKFKKYGYSVQSPPWWVFYLFGHKGFFIFTK